MPRGGKRPGAGAPRGNLNGFKHGRNSQQHRQLVRLIARDPEALGLLREMAEHHNRRTKRLRKQAEQLLAILLDQAQAQPGDQSNQTFAPISVGDLARIAIEREIDEDIF
jgi:hypothetical protein